MVVGGGRRRKNQDEEEHIKRHSAAIRVRGVAEKGAGIGGRTHYKFHYFEQRT